MVRMKKIRLGTNHLASLALGGSLLGLWSCSSLPADMGKSNYSPPYLLCQCGNYRTALDPSTEHPLGSACPCDPAIRATTGTVVQR